MCSLEMLQITACSGKAGKTKVSLEKTTARLMQNDRWFYLKLPLA